MKSIDKEAELRITGDIDKYLTNEWTRQKEMWVIKYKGRIIPMGNKGSYSTKGHMRAAFNSYFTYGEYDKKEVKALIQSLFDQGIVENVNIAQ